MHHGVGHLLFDQHALLDVLLDVLGHLGNPLIPTLQVLIGGLTPSENFLSLQNYILALLFSDWSRQLGYFLDLAFCITETTFC